LELLACGLFFEFTKDSIDFKERRDDCLEGLACLADCVRLGIEVSGACGGNELEEDDNDEVIVYGDEEEFEVSWSSEDGGGGGGCCAGGCGSCGIFVVLEGKLFGFMVFFLLNTSIFNV
jgi:hypothetical protein